MCVCVCLIYMHVYRSIFVDEEKISPSEHSLMLTECLLRPNGGCQQSEVWIVCFISGNSNMQDKPCSAWPYRCLQARHAGSRLSLAKKHS